MKDVLYVIIINDTHLIVLDCEIVSRPFQMGYLLIRTVKWEGRVGFTDFMISIWGTSNEITGSVRGPMPIILLLT